MTKKRARNQGSSCVGTTRPTITNMRDEGITRGYVSMRTIMTIGIYIAHHIISSCSISEVISLRTIRPARNITDIRITERLGLEAALLLGKIIADESSLCRMTVNYPRTNIESIGSRSTVLEENMMKRAIWESTLMFQMWKLRVESAPYPMRADWTLFLTRIGASIIKITWRIAQSPILVG